MAKRPNPFGEVCARFRYDDLTVATPTKSLTAFSSSSSSSSSIPSPPSSSSKRQRVKPNGSEDKAQSLGDSQQKNALDDASNQTSRNTTKKKGYKAGGKEGAAATLVEKYCTPGHGERPLRLIIVGHNPSDHAWRTGHYYSNPSNRMWKLLSTTGIIKPGFTSVDDDRCPWECGVGFTDLGTGNPGTKSGEFKSSLLWSWRRSLYERLQAHANRAKAYGRPGDHACGSPRVIAFSGKRQYKELFFDSPGYSTLTIHHGVQATRPPGWPFDPSLTQVLVLASSSGAAAMTNEQREAPYRELASLLQALPPWQEGEEEGGGDAS